MKRKFAGILLGTLLAFHAAAQTPEIHYGVPALKFRSPATKRLRSYYVDYVQYGQEPAFRIRAHHYHAWCNGYLYITPSRIAYDPSLTPFQKDGMMFTRADITSITPRFAGYQFVVQDKSYKFAFLSDPDGPAQNSNANQRAELMNFVSLAYSNFGAAQQFLFAKLAGISARLDSPPTALSFEAEPVIRILSPRGVMPNVTVDADSPSGSIAGIAAAASGISQVAIHGSPVRLVEISKQIVFFQSDRTTLQPGMTEAVVSATAVNGAQNSVTFRLVKPEVRILSPVPVSKTRDDKVTVKGMVLGMHDLSQVHVAGKAVPMSKRDDGGFDFQSQSVPLVVGANTITGFTERTNGQRSTFDFIVFRVPPVPALTVDGIEKALRNSVSPVRLEALVDQQGVDFDLNPEVERRLRAAGATKSLLDAIADAHVTHTQ